MECGISCIFQIMHIDFFFSSLWKLRPRILRSIFENYYTTLLFLYIILFSFVFCKKLIILITIFLIKHRIANI